jgi:HSP20 family protein
MRGLTRRSGAMQPYSGGLQPMFSMLDDLRREFDRFFQDAETMLPTPAATVAGSAWTAFVPPVDIHETDKTYVVTAEVPGIDPKNIDVRLEGNTLIIRGEREQQRDEDIGTMHRSERSFGSFSRAFTLPQDVQTETINAKFRNGVLTITVPKSQTMPSKQVQIEAEEGAAPSRQIEQSQQMGIGNTPQAQQKATGGVSNTAAGQQGQRPNEQISG